MDKVMNKVMDKVMNKTPITYYGGKQRIASQLQAMLPAHSCYCEPFVGGGALLWHKPVFQGVKYVEAINDYDERVVNFWRVLRDTAQEQELIRMLKLTPYSRAEYKEAWRILQDTTECSIKRAWAFYIQTNWSFSGIINAGWSRGTTCNKAAYVNRNNLWQVQRMSHVYIDQKDACEFIKVWDSPQTFFFCDPPYPGSDQGHYGGYTMDNLLALVDVLNTCQGSYLLTCYNNDLPLNGASRTEISTVMSAVKPVDGKRANNKRTEQVYFRHATVAPEQKEAKKMMAESLKYFLPTPFVGKNQMEFF